jgi:hypothetical protein
MEDLIDFIERNFKIAKKEGLEFEVLASAFLELKHPSISIEEALIRGLREWDI